MAQSLRMHESDVTLVDLLSNRFAPIQHTLMGFLDAYAEVKLRRVCKALSSSSLGYRNWDYVLGKFFSDAKDFRSRQAEWNGIIMGNVVFSNTDNLQPDRDMDTSLAALFEVPGNSTRRRSESAEEREAVLGSDLVEKLDQIRKYEEEWLEDIREMRK